MASSSGIPMKHPDGRPYEAESESESMQLMALGYTRLDAGKKAPPASSAADAKPGSGGKSDS